MLTDYDLHLLGEGRHWKSYDKLGAQVCSRDGQQGVHFALWAPNAEMVSVVGDFNNWTGQNHMMNKSVPSGFWQLFVPDIRVNTAYKFRVQTVEGTIDRADPYGYSAEVPPKNASIITDLSEYRWKDSQWMEQRLRRDWFSEPISFYEVHLGVSKLSRVYCLFTRNAKFCLL